MSRARVAAVPGGVVVLPGRRGPGLGSQALAVDHQEARRDLGLDAKRFTPRGVHSLISLWKNELVDPIDAADKAENIFDRKHAEVYAEYQARLLKAGAMDFDDLLLSWWHLMQVPAMAQRIGARFDHVLVDAHAGWRAGQHTLDMRRLGPDGNFASDHRALWVDLELPLPPAPRP